MYFRKHTKIFRAALLEIKAKNWKLPKCSSKRERIVYRYIYIISRILKERIIYTAICINIDESQNDKIYTKRDTVYIKFRN